MPIFFTKKSCNRGQMPLTVNVGKIVGKTVVFEYGAKVVPRYMNCMNILVVI